MVNLGDCYANGGRGTRAPDRKLAARGMSSRPADGSKPKDLLMIPARVALALQADGWYVRSEIVWHKPNPVPESVKDRPTCAHEKVFLMTKSERYFYDHASVQEASAVGGTRNLRNVWTVVPRPYRGAHFATMPPDLAERCIRAGSRPGDTVLDPFGGAGTTALVANRLGRRAVLCEINPEYAALAEARIATAAAEPDLLSFMLGVGGRRDGTGEVDAASGRPAGPHAFGNAIVPQVSTETISAIMKGEP